MLTTVYCPECDAGSIFNGMRGDRPCWICPACGHEFITEAGTAC